MSTRLREVLMERMGELRHEPTDLLQRSDKRSVCAYKGRASYWSLEGEPDVAWSYPEPLREAREIAGLIAFFDERVEVELEGRAMERALTPWSPR